MERRRMRRKPAFGKRIMVTMLSLVMLLSMLSPGLLAGADETTTDPTVQQTPETPNDQAPAADGQTQLTDRVKTGSNFKDSFIDAFMDAYDQQTQNGGEQLGSLALSYIAKYDMLKTRVQALDPAVEDYAAQVEALNAEIAALDAAVAASVANGELTEVEAASVRAAAVGSVTAPAPDGSSDEAGLKQQTVTAYVNNMTFAVSGKMPEGASLSVTPVDATVNDYIHNNILGLGALPAGYTGEAFDIKLLDKDGIEFQPTEQVNVGVTADGITEDSDVSVYHLPGTCADDVYAGYQRDVAGIALMARLMTQLIGEKVETVNVYDGYYAFLADGFSVYYVVAGTSNDTSAYDTTIRDLPRENSTYYVEAGTIISFNNAGSDWTNVTTTSGITRTNGTITVSRDAQLGETAVFRRNNISLTFIVSERTQIIENAVSTQPVYLAIRLETNLPGEPGVTDGQYKRLNSNYVANTGWAWEEYIFSDTASGIINPGISETVYVTPDGSSTVGVYDATGAVCMNYIVAGSIDWDKMLTVAIQNGANATDGTRVTNNNRNNYEVIPYVVKYMVERGIGWHIDCIVVPKVRITLSYDLNLKNYVVPENTLALPDAVVKNSEFSTTVGYIKKDSANLKIGDTIKATLDGETYNLTFKGWAKDDPNATTSTNNPGTSINVTKDTVLYAIWEGKAGVGGLKIQKNISGFTPADDESFDFTVKPDTDVDAEEFAAWCTANKYTVNSDGSITVTVTVKGGSTTNVVTLAKLPIGSYTITEINVPDKYSASAAKKVNVGSEQTVTADITNTLITTSVKITKYITGNMGDVSTSFPFVVTSNKPITVTENTTGYNVSADGTTVRFSLSHDQSVVIQGVPIGAQLNITEKECAGFTVTIDGGDPVKLQDSAEASASKKVEATKDKEIVVVNDRSVAIDTGVELNSFPFIMMLSSCIVMAVFFLIGKKRMMF